MEHDTGLGARGRRRGRPARQRLLVKHLGAGLAVNPREAEFGQGQGLADAELGGIIRPTRSVSNRQGVSRDRIALRRRARQRPQIRQGRTDRGLGSKREARHIKIRSHRIPKLHAKGRCFGRIVRAAIDPVVALAIAKQKRGIKVLNRGGRCGIDLRPIAGERGLRILGQLSNRVQGERQQGNRHRRRHGRTRDDRVVEHDGTRRASRAELASHFERAHRGPAIGWRGVGD